MTNNLVYCLWCHRWVHIVTTVQVYPVNTTSGTIAPRRYLLSCGHTTEREGP